MNGFHGGDIWGASDAMGCGPGEVVDFSASINPLGLSPRARAALRGCAGLLGSYPDPRNRLIRGALSRFHDIPPENILPCNGSTELIHLIPRLLRPKKALIVEPAFSEFTVSLRLSGCKVEGFLCRERDLFRPDAGEIFKRLGRGYDLVFISNPASPTGVLLEKGLLLRLAGECRRRGTVLVIDEAFCDFTDQESVKREATRRGNLLVLRSMTKFFAMAGLRLGFLVARRDAIGRFSSILPPWSVNTAAAIAGAATLTDKNYIRRTLRWFERERAFVSRGLGAIDGLRVFPSEANFFMVKITRRGIDSPLLRERLARERILIRDMTGFRGLGRRMFRVALRSRRDNRLLLGALKKALEAP